MVITEMSIPLSVLAPVPSPTLTPPVGPWAPSEPPNHMHIQEWK